MIKKIIASMLLVLSISSSTVFASGEVVKTFTYNPPKNVIANDVSGRYDITSTLRMTFPDEYFGKNLTTINDVMNNKKTDITDPFTNSVKDNAYWYQEGLYLLPLQIQAYDYKLLDLGVPNLMLTKAIEGVKTNNTPGKTQILQMHMAALDRYGISSSLN